MRILLIPPRYAPHHGGVERVVREIATQIQSAGHEVAIITNRWPRTLPKHETIDGIPVTRLIFLFPLPTYLRTGRLDLLLAGLVFFPLTFIQLHNIIRQFKPDVVNPHYVGNQTPFVWLSQRLRRFRLVVSLHGGDVVAEPYQDRLKRWLFGQLVGNAEKITTCSQALLDQALLLAPHIASKSTIVRNGADVERFSNAPPHTRPRPYLFSVGRLEHHKGFDVLIAGFEKIAGEFPEYDLLIAGRGPEHQTLEAQIKACGLSDRISLYGAPNDQELASLMRGSRAVVIPSRREWFGIAALEATAAGRPVVARRVGGLPEALADADVTWVEDENPMNMGAALRKVLANGSMASSETDQHRPQARSWQAVGKDFIAVLEAT